MHDSRVVANRLLELAKTRNDTITPMQLLKLVYIAHGWMLGLYGRPLVRDEIQAWQYGPVIPLLYTEVRQYRSNPVLKPVPAPVEELAPQEQSIINQVYNIYGSFSGPQLSRLTHAEGTPWALTYSPGKFGAQISNDIIQDHYRQKADASGGV